MTIDQDKLNAFMGKFVGELGAVLHAPTIILGDKLRLYKAMAEGPVTAKELAARTGVIERYALEWLSAQAAAGFVEYDGVTGTFTLPPEQAFTLADSDSPAYIPGAYYIAASLFRDVDKVADAFKSGKGFGWNEHDGDLFCGTELFFRPGYTANLVTSWLPALNGTHETLKQGGTVADVGCGYGASTIIMAQAYPNSRFFGYDSHPASIEAARASAQMAGVADRVVFEVASAKQYPGRDFDLVTFFDCLHDMGDPAGASAHVRQSLKPSGAWMIVEPYANERLEDNLNPVGRVFYSASTMVCTPASLAQEVGTALGAQASEARLREVVLSGGFSRFRRATETPFNRIFEAKP